MAQPTVIVKRIRLKGIADPSAALMSILGQTFIRIQTKRVLSGAGSDDGPMDPYSEKYAALRAKKGRPTGIRNLSFTGRMLKARLLKAVTNFTAVIGWGAGIEQAKAEGNDDRTPWIKPSPADRAYLVAQSRNAIIQQIAKNLARARATKGVSP